MGVVLTGIVIGLLFGPLDLAGQVHTPYPFANLFNSPAIWAACAFVVGRWAARPAQAVVAATVAMVVAVEAYYAADIVVRGANTSNLTSNVAMAWLALGVGAGLVFGLAGAFSTRTHGWLGALASAALPAVFLAEAAHEATTSREPGWMTSLVGAAAIATWWVLRTADGTATRRTALCIAALTAAGFVAYAPFG